MFKKTLHLWSLRVVTGILLIFLSVPSVLFSDPGALGDDEYARLKLIKEAYLKMHKFYFKEIPHENIGNLFYRCQFIMMSLLKNPADNYMQNLDQLAYSTINMIVEALKDPTDKYSKFIHKDLLTRVVRENLVSKFTGIGIEVEKKDDLFFIAKVYGESSALEAGVMVGDELLEIDGVSTAGMQLSQIEKVLKIPAGSFVTLTLRHYGSEEPFFVRLECRIIWVPSVTSNYLDDVNIGVVKISQFRNETAQEFLTNLNTFSEYDMQGLIIDLRNNSGGDETQAVALAGMFLPKDSLVVYFLKKDVGRREERTKREPLNLSYPIVILTNQKTASSAEIFSGVMKEYEKALIIGTNTNGQGSLKNTIGLSDGSALLLITSRTYLPDNQTFDEIGIAPSITVHGENAQLEEAIHVLSGRKQVEEA
jgi:carboxyl-terminal processing protease